MTDIEALRMSIDQLGGIRIPAVYFEEIAFPIYKVRNNLLAVYDALIKASQTRATDDEKKHQNGGTEVNDGDTLPDSADRPE